MALVCGLVPRADGAPLSASAPAAPALAPPPVLQPLPRSAEAWALLLAEHTGPRAELAARLGIGERTLYRRLRAPAFLPGSAPPNAHWQK